MLVRTGILTTQPQTAALFTRPQKPAEPADRVELSKPSENLWREVDRLGIWTSLAGVTPPLGSVLSQAAQAELLDLCSKVKLGFSLDPSSPRMARTPWEDPARQILTWDDPQGRFDRLNLVAENADFAPINNFEDLRAMEAFVLTKDLDAVKNPDLAKRLVQLEEAGAHLQMLNREEKQIRPGTYREVGAYGAYQAWPEDRLLVNGVPLKNERDLEMAEFFLLGEPDKQLLADPRATTLRDLQNEGFDFLRGAEREPVDALSAYRYGVIDRMGDVKVCLEGLAPETLMVNGERLNPVSNRMQELMAFAKKHFDDIPPRDGALYLRALTTPAPLSLEDRWEILQRLKTSEKSAPAMLASFEQLLKATATHEKTNDLVPEYQELRERGLPIDKAGEALAYLHQQLPSLTYGEQDFQQERDALAELAQHTGSLQEAARARTLLLQKGEEPYEERLQALRRVKNPANYQALTEGQLPITESALQLSRLLEQVPEPEAREAFGYLARGVHKRAFPDLQQAVDRYLRERELAHEPVMTRQLCQCTEPFEQRKDARVETAEDFRTIWAGPHNDLRQSAEDLKRVQALVDPETAREIFRNHRDRLEDHIAALKALKAAEALHAYPDLEGQEDVLQATRAFLQDRLIGTPQPAQIGERADSVVIGGVRLPKTK